MSEKTSFEIRATQGLNAEPTVKTQMGRTPTKLGARDRVQVVVIAHRSGLA